MKIKFTISIIIILSFIAIILILNNSNSTFNKEYKNFAIEDSSIVTKIFISDKKNHNLLLKKIYAGKWILNNKYIANNEIVNTLLKTMLSIEVRCPVPKMEYNNLISRMASIAVKVEIYQRVYRIDLFNYIKLFPHEKLTKTYYVGDQTKDNIGTYMLIEGSKMPFVTFIPGFRGFLSTRYVPKEDIWRDQTIFNIKLKEIKSITLEYPETPDSSFNITQVGKLKYELTQLYPKKIIAVYDTLKVLSYLSSFTNIKYESLLNDIDKKQIDSITKSRPYHILTLIDIYGKTTKIKTFHKTIPGGKEYDEATKGFIFNDRDRFYGLINGDKDFSLIQFYIFSKIIKPINYFAKI